MVALVSEGVNFRPFRRKELADGAADQKNSSTATSPQRASKPSSDTCGKVVNLGSLLNRKTMAERANPGAIRRRRSIARAQTVFPFASWFDRGNRPCIHLSESSSGNLECREDGKRKNDEEQHASNRGQKNCTPLIGENATKCLDVLAFSSSRPKITS